LEHVSGAIGQRHHGAIGNRSVDCTPTGSDNYGRTLAVCSTAHEDLNGWMVRQGWALAFTKYSKVYVAEEEQARNAQRGLWSGAFIAPWDWRHRNCKTQVLGAISVPISADAYCPPEGGPGHGRLDEKSLPDLDISLL
jgi:Staphylococcal nuclease homologue